MIELSSWLPHAWADVVGAWQQGLHEHIAQPLLLMLGLSNYVEDAYAACGWLLIGVFQLLLLLLVLVPLEHWRPVEAVRDRAAVRVDMLYTAIHRLGLFQLAWFFAVQPLWDDWQGWLAVQGWVGGQLDTWMAPWWQGVSDQPGVVFLVYLLVLDFVDYWIHRGQHRWAWWWALHAVHHSQRQMTCWSDSRNHLLDDLLRDLILVQVSQLIGVAPGQFVLLVAVRQLLENLAHANLRLSFGRWGEAWLVSPRFHRQHHGLAWVPGLSGSRAGGCNFAVLLPVWDRLFGTCAAPEALGPTGIQDQLPEAGGRDYGRGFWAQQRLGVLRLFGRA
jgi:sterol desaturase/sphingolipid hydroxylase (fatty acid hydroxylase superfamily)